MDEFEVSIVTFYYCYQLYRVYNTYWATESCKKILKDTLMDVYKLDLVNKNNEIL
jgi:hypothetical protein